MLTRLIALASASLYVCLAQATVSPKVLTQDQVLQLEAQVAANPSDLNSQALLGYNCARRAVYDVNMLMARDIESAKKYLLASTSGTGGGQFTPNMTLAKDLIITGETATVFQFFNPCKNVCPSGASMLDTWTQDLGIF